MKNAQIINYYYIHLTARMYETIVKCKFSEVNQEKRGCSETVMHFIL